jgi:hypothetical protein
LGQIWCASDFHYSCMQSCTTSFTFSQDFCPSSVLLSPMHYQFTFSQYPNHALWVLLSRFLPRFLLVIISTMLYWGRPDGRTQLPIRCGAVRSLLSAPLKKNLSTQQGARQPGVLVQEGFLVRVLVEQATELARVFATSHRCLPRPSCSPTVLVASPGARPGGSVRPWCALRSASVGAPTSSMRRRWPPHRRRALQWRSLYSSKQPSDIALKAHVATVCSSVLDVSEVCCKCFTSMLQK